MKVIALYHRKMILKKTGILILTLLSNELLFSQNIGSKQITLNNVYWKVVALKAKREYREVLYKSSDFVPDIKFINGLLLFSNDSLVLAMSCDDNKIVSAFKFKQTDIVEFYGIDKNVNFRDRLTYNEPALRKFNHYTFSYSFRVKMNDKSEVLLISKKPKVRLVLMHFMAYDPDNPVQCQ